MNALEGLDLALPSAFIKGSEKMVPSSAVDIVFSEQSGKWADDIIPASL